MEDSQSKGKQISLQYSVKKSLFLGGNVVNLYSSIRVPNTICQTFLRCRLCQDQAVAEIRDQGLHKFGFQKTKKDRRAVKKQKSVN